jgi:predicted nucleotidyltransferase component of viral defense system
MGQKIAGGRKIAFMIAEAIERLADRVLAYDEPDLNELLNYFKTRMEQLEVSPAWERAVIAYFLINGVRVKNALKKGNAIKTERRQGGRPTLRLVKV